MKEDAKSWSSQKSLHHIDILDKKFTWMDRFKVKPRVLFTLLPLYRVCYRSY